MIQHINDLLGRTVVSLLVLSAAAESHDAKLSHCPESKASRRYPGSGPTSVQARECLTWGSHAGSKPQANVRDRNDKSYWLKQSAIYRSSRCFAQAEFAHTHIQTKGKRTVFVCVVAKPLLCVRTGQMKTSTTKDGLIKHLISKRLGSEPDKADKKEIPEVGQCLLSIYYSSLHSWLRCKTPHTSLERCPGIHIHTQDWRYLSLQVGDYSLNYAGWCERQAEQVS